MNFVDEKEIGAEIGDSHRIKNLYRMSPFGSVHPEAPPATFA